MPRLQPASCRKIAIGGISLLLAALASALPLQAQSATTNPMGFMKLGAYDTGGNYLGLLANSDTLISIPFTRPPDYTGAVSSITGNVVTVSGTPGWTANQFVYAGSTQPKTYYALIGPAPVGSPANPKEGSIYSVTANGTGTLTLALNGDTLQSVVPAGSQITLIPYWTLATIFPASDANVSFTPTASARSFKTEILIPDYAGVGTNLSISKIYYYFNSGANVGWRLLNDTNTVDHGDDILMPDGYFAVRNQNSSPTLPLVVTGCVLTGKMIVPLATGATAGQDNPSAIIRPVDVTLNTCGLSTTDGSFVATTSARSFKDEILLYNNAQVGMNKSFSAIYYYMNNAWRSLNDLSTVDHGSDVIPAGSAVVIRKAANGTGQTAFWTNPPNY